MEPQPSHTMNDDHSASLPPREIHSVFEFALVPVPNGSPRQSVKNVGEFESIEHAFATALDRARREAALLAHQYATLASAEAGEPVLTLLSTEWGYDLRHEHQTVMRYWIHSRPAPAA